MIGFDPEYRCVDGMSTCPTFKPPKQSPRRPAANKLAPSQSLTIKKSTTSQSPKFACSSAITLHERFSKKVVHLPYTLPLSSFPLRISFASL
jgi:hypothetical protein